MAKKTDVKNVVSRISADELKEILAKSETAGGGKEGKRTFIKSVIGMMDEGTVITTNVVKALLEKGGFNAKHNAERRQIMIKLQEEGLVDSGGKNERGRVTWVVKPHAT